MSKSRSNTNLVFFYSEGPPNDNALNLSEHKDMVLQCARDHVDEIAWYTPKKLIELGHPEFVKEFDSLGLASSNKGMSKIGFSAWKPKIMLLELDKMNDGDVLIYRDANIGKYPQLGNYNGIKEIALQCFELCGLDFFVPHHSFPIKNRNLTKTNVLRELGENHIFSYEYPTIMANTVFVRKSNISIELLNEWANACTNDQWIDGNQYGELDKDFSHSTNEQAILSTIIANWIRTRKHNIPLCYPLISFQDRDIAKIKFDQNFIHLALLNTKNISFLEPPEYIKNRNLKGLFSYIKLLLLDKYGLYTRRLERLKSRLRTKLKKKPNR